MIRLKLAERLRRWRERQSLRAQLFAMDERQLADIGLSRADIESVVKGVANRDGTRRNRKAA